MELKKLSERQYKTIALKLYQKNKEKFESFNGFDLFHKKILLGKNSFLKNKVKPTHYAGFVEGHPYCLTTHFESLDGHPNTLGNFLFEPDINDWTIKNYFTALRKELKGSVLAPMNAHPNLGISYPDFSGNGSFLTANSHPVLDKVFGASGFFERTKKYYAYSVKVDETLKTKIVKDLAIAPIDFTTRDISRLRFKRDIKIYNCLVKETMKLHDLFIPLDFNEEWELMRDSLLILEPSYFKFLMHRGKEIGFCFGIPDYNQILKNDEDSKNILRILTQKKRITKGRIIYSGILPEFQGKGLFKFVRHKVIQSMIDNGIQEIESSYIDEANTKSLQNVQSTGAIPARTFSLYRFLTQS